MHELSISQAIAELVLQESEKKEAKKVLLVELEIGQLSMFNPEQVEFWLKLAFEQTLASEAKIQIEAIKPEIRCFDCEYEGEIEVEDDPLYHFLTPIIKCPSCGSAKIEIEKGRDCLLKKIEVLA